MRSQKRFPVSSNPLNNYTLQFSLNCKGHTNEYRTAVRLFRKTMPNQTRLEQARNQFRFDNQVVQLERVDRSDWAINSHLPVVIYTANGIKNLKIFCPCDAKLM